jgi:5-formyltetrahydrofolate cyclo-ligase
MEKGMSEAQNSRPMKSIIRHRMRLMLAAIPVETAAERSRAACAAVIGLEEFSTARVIMLYVPLPGELDTTPIAQAARRAGKTVLVPRVFWDRCTMIGVATGWPEERLAADDHGLRQPAGGQPWPVEDIDLIITPGLAFDRLGNRLGRGGGYYDRFLSQNRIRAVTCGLAFAEQIVEAMPVSQEDRRVDMIVTDKEVLRFAAP